MSELGNEVWEYLFSELKGDVPEALNERVCDGIAEAVLIASKLAMTPTSEVVARLDELIGQYFDLGYAEGVAGRDADTMAGDAQAALSEIQALISSLVAENAELLNRAEVAEYKQAQAVNETQPMIIARAETAERLLAEAVEQAFRDGLAYGGNVENADPDTAWLHSKARASTGGVNG